MRTGLAIQRVDYVRMQHPRQTRVTGSSRDATLWLERGRPVARLPQFRFTVRLDELFSSLEGSASAASEARPIHGERRRARRVSASFPVDVVTG